MLKSFSWIIENKLAAMAHPGQKPEVFELLKDKGVGAIVTLTETRISAHLIDGAGLDYLHLPIDDFSTPTVEQVKAFNRFVEKKIKEGNSVVVHCLAGIGRTGTMVACYLVSKGKNPDDAICLVRKLRPGSIETKEQHNLVLHFKEEK